MKPIEQEIYTFLEERGWDTLRPSDVAKSLSIESAELLEIFQWSNESLEEVKEDEEKLAEVKKEVADVLIYAYQMTVLLELDTEEVMREKLRKIEEKYPPELMKQGAEEGAGSGNNKIYWYIKKKERANNSKE